jgi:hypothetical protein
MKPRPRDDDAHVDLLADFCALLLDALQVDEIREALLDITRTAAPPPPARVPTPSARAGARRRGQR